MSTKQKAYLPEATSTELSEDISYESSKNIVLSYRTNKLIPLEEISQYDMIFDPDSNLTERQARHLVRRIKRLRVLADLKTLAPMAFVPLAMAVLFPIVEFAFAIRDSNYEHMGLILGGSAVFACLSTAFMLPPYIADSQFKKLLQKHRVIEFPNLSSEDLSNETLTYEQVYEIARIGTERAKLSTEKHEVLEKLYELEKQIKSPRVFKEIEKLNSQKKSLYAEEEKLTEKIASVISNGKNNPV